MRKTINLSGITAGQWVAFASHSPRDKAGMANTQTPYHAHPAPTLFNFGKSDKIVNAPGPKFGAR